MAQLWFKFWAKEYLADTKVRRLSYEQRGILQALWAMAWEEGSIPNSQEELGNMLGINNAKAMRSHMEWISRFFVPSDDPTKLISPRLEMDRQEADAKGAKARASALQRWNERNANAYANASVTDQQTQYVNTCVPHAGQSQSTEKESTTTARARAKGPKLVEVGSYPQELEEGHSLWRELLKFMNSDEIQSKFHPEKRFTANQVGTREKSWKAWEKHLSHSVQGNPVTSAHVLQALKVWADTKRARAERGESLSCPMLPSMLNSPDFVDAVVAVVKRGMEVPHAS